MPLDLVIPGRKPLHLEHAVFDVNGTLAWDGELIEGVAERLEILARQLQIHMITADTHGKQAQIDKRLGIAATRMTPGGEPEQKAALIEQLGRQRCAAIGNGSNDVLMLAAAALSIGVVGPEGISAEALRTTDIIAPSILAALDLLIYPARLVATLRT
jgi:P-type E1-E2 ATPase